ncbi:DUF1392 family protein [Nostoc parmelioides]|uniref:DUF1392 family protein n=1 Tax=Nostoc parmelioides FACHB-3921 TaxID=2692909 RepID=A0ABR8BQI3_9NOSO|nr:DUF1392 family protein [Nostoc parmelioides]MBD2255175.1 DUF1392 family protein [Nostoc parmelioides FACHB-3921]
MTNPINSLETCWYISPPWGQQVPVIALSLLEKVYLPSEKVTGYCCGIEWSDDGWSYSIASQKGIISVPDSEIIASGQLQPLVISKPQFRLGQLVNFRFANDGPKIRMILGMSLINHAWLYQVEWKSPALKLPTDEGVCIFPKSTQQGKFINRLSWVTPHDLSEVV